jgi:hypothetical protein
MFQCGHAANRRSCHVQQLGLSSRGHDLARAPSIRLIRPAFRFVSTKPGLAPGFVVFVQENP